MPLILHFLNVGKGNCTVIDFPSGRLSVVDIDDSRSIPKSRRQQLKKEGKAELTNPIDYIVSGFKDRGEIFRFILTHPDMDHMSGIKTIFDKIYVRNFWYVPENKPDPGKWEHSLYDKEDWDFYHSLKNNSIENVTVISPLRNGTAECCWVQDGISILSPNSTLINKAEETGDYDHLSYVIKIHFNGINVLLPGDATKYALNDIVANYDEDDLTSSILLAPGHGSKNHVSTEFLEAVKPRLTIVSVAEGVDYDYNSYKNYGRVLSTKEYGNVSVRIDDNKEIVFNTQFGKYHDNWYILKSRSEYYGK